MKKIIAVIAALTMAAASLTACQKSGESTAKTAKVIDIDLTNEEYAFGVDKDQPELLEKVNAFIKEIKDNGKFDEICSHYFGDGEPVGVESAAYDASKDQLVVATNAAFEPFEYTIGDKYAGIDMEIAGALAEYLGVELVVQNMDFDAVCLSVGQHIFFCLRITYLCADFLLPLFRLQVQVPVTLHQEVEFSELVG